MSKITNDDNPDWQRMFYSCTHMATVGFEGLITFSVLTRSLHTWWRAFIIVPLMGEGHSPVSLSLAMPLTKTASHTKLSLTN